MKDHATFTFGRFSPPTTGHKKLVDAVVKHAKETGGDHYIFPSHTQDAKKNPLSHGDKVHFMKKMMPHANIVDHPDVKSAIHAVKHLAAKGHSHITMIAGEDRVPEFHRLLHSYNGKEYHVKHLEVKSAGHRDPDAEGVEGMSASKQRDHAKSGNFSEFRKGVPVKKHAKDLYHAVRKGMKVENVLANFKAIFLVGGPGSGKDFLIHSVLDECKLKEVSLDKLLIGITEGAEVEELHNFPSVIINGNADNLNKVIVAKAVMESMGYDTAMIYVYTTDEESKSRNDERISRGAKTFTESVRRHKYECSYSNVHQFAEIFDAFVLYDNSNNFSNVNEEKQKEIASWLVELSETISIFLSKMPKNEAALEWIAERVLEVGTDATAAFAKAITPGQGTNNVRTYQEADEATKPRCKACNGACKCGTNPATERTGGTSIANASTSERTYAAEGLRRNIRNSVQKEKVYEEEKDNNNKKEGTKKVAKVTNTPSNYDRAGSVAVGSMGVSSVAEDDKKKKKKKLLPGSTELKPLDNVVNLGNTGLVGPWAQSEGTSFDKLREKISTKIRTEELG